MDRFRNRSKFKLWFEYLGRRQLAFTICLKNLQKMASWRQRCK